MPSTVAFSQSTAAAMLAANQKLTADYALLQQNPNNQSLFKTVQQDVVNYYTVQESQRGYASLAAAVAGQSDYNGFVAAQNVENA